MRTVIVLAASVASLITSVSIPVAASAQEWRYDPCHAERHDAARNGTIAGGVLGAIVGSQMAGRGHHTEGAIIGGGVGAVAGHQIGASTVSCRPYPAGYRYHPGCHWIQDRHHGRWHGYEVCPGRDGYWRPYDGY
jgi:uncharacterized protein YcfJ